jgi:hypothetical protein
MKTLTTLTAVVALIAGMSIASAASSTSGAMGTNSMSKAKITGMSKFCVKGASGALNCQYASLTACQSANKGKTCEANPHIGTTGSK